MQLAIVANSVDARRATGGLDVAEDSRVVQLADALEAEHRGEGPIGRFDDPEVLSRITGEKVNLAPGAQADAVEVDLGDGVRGSMEDVSAEHFADVVLERCTPPQIKALNKLCRKGKHRPVGCLNVRIRGGAAIGDLYPVVEDRFGMSWIILPEGRVENSGNAGGDVQ